MPVIEFVGYSEDAFENFEPVAASRIIPEWISNLPPFLTEEKIEEEKKVSKCPFAKFWKYKEQRPDQKDGNESIKLCPAVNDLVTSGYIVRTNCDLEINYLGGVSFTGDSKLKTYAGKHRKEQFYSYDSWPYDCVKFEVPWHVKTPPGYSCIFTDPFYNEHEDFCIASGIIDTDKFFYNGLAIIQPKKLESFIIPKGTPLYQIIPFQREDWTSEIKLIDFDEIDHIMKETEKLTTSFEQRQGSYKKLFWEPKKYK